MSPLPARQCVAFGLIVAAPVLQRNDFRVALGPMIGVIQP